MRVPQYAGSRVGSTLFRVCEVPDYLVWIFGEFFFLIKPELLVHEDNQALIRVVQPGRNPTMRYLLRTHRCSVAWLHERFKGTDLKLVYEDTSRQCADIYTKPLHGCCQVGGSM